MEFEHRRTLESKSREQKPEAPQVRAKQEETSSDGSKESLERLKVENEELKAQLAKERTKLEFLEQEISHENQTLEYDPKINIENFSLGTIREVLHDELIEFDGQISQITETQKDIIKLIETAISKCAQEISPEIEVTLRLN